jgi:hypothetical protein
VQTEYAGDYVRMAKFAADFASRSCVTAMQARHGPAHRKATLACSANARGSARSVGHTASHPSGYGAILRLGSALCFRALGLKRSGLKSLRGWELSGRSCVLTARGLQAGRVLDIFSAKPHVQATANDVPVPVESTAWFQPPLGAVVNARSHDGGACIGARRRCL